MGAAFGEPAQRRAAIVRFNALFADLCAARGIAFVDGILAISGDAGARPDARRVGRAAPVGRPVPALGQRADRAGGPAPAGVGLSADPQRSGVSQTGYSVMFSGLPSLAERS